MDDYYVWDESTKQEVYRTKSRTPDAAIRVYLWVYPPGPMPEAIFALNCSTQQIHEFRQGPEYTYEEHTS